mgnify:CR=1 FL=1
MGELLSAYLWIILLSSLLATAFLATKVSSLGLKFRLPTYFAAYNLVCLVLRMVMPTKELALTLNWMNPLLGIAYLIILPFDQAFHVAEPVIRIGIRATATLVLSTAIWVALGFIIGAMLDDRLEEKP